MVFTKKDTKSTKEPGLKGLNTKAQGRAKRRLEEKTVVPARPERAQQSSIAKSTFVWQRISFRNRPMFEKTMDGDRDVAVRIKILCVVA